MGRWVGGGLLRRRKGKKRAFFLAIKGSVLDASANLSLACLCRSDRQRKWIRKSGESYHRAQATCRYLHRSRKPRSVIEAQLL